LALIIALSLYNHELGEVKDGLKRLLVRVATLENLLVNFIRQSSATLVQLLHTLLHTLLVVGQAVNDGIRQFDLLLQFKD